MLESRRVFTQGSLVRLFKSILENKTDAVLTDDKRKAPRFVLGDNFAFKTKLALFQHNGTTLPEGKAREWGATVANLSATGASLQLSMAAVAYAKEKCRLKFTRKDYVLEIPATIAHFRCYSQYSLCGVVFNFPDAEAQQAYLQLLEPVVLGHSLAWVGVIQGDAGRMADQFTGINSALTIWRSSAEGPIMGFDFRMRQYAVRWTEGHTELELGATMEDHEGTSDALVALTGEQHDEVHWLFCLSVPNLSKAVPADVRKFLSTTVE